MRTPARISSFLDTRSRSGQGITRYWFPTLFDNECDQDVAIMKNSLHASRDATANWRDGERGVRLETYVLTDWPLHFRPTTTQGRVEPMFCSLTLQHTDQATDSDSYSQDVWARKNESMTVGGRPMWCRDARAHCWTVRGSRRRKPLQTRNEACSRRCTERWRMTTGSDDGARWRPEARS